MLPDLRADFPILETRVAERPLVYLDSAATTQKPQAVIDAISQYYRQANANVHRGVYALSQRATDAFEQVRFQVQKLVNARHVHEVIFTSGTTAAINLIAQSYGRCFLKQGDEIIVSAMEHHANIVPWQMLVEQLGVVIKVLPVLDNGELDLSAYRQLLTERVKLVAVTHVSNVLGTVNPIAQITEWAHANNAVVVVDGAQAVAHRAVDVQALGCDFYVFSAHKMYGPTGVGVLVAKEKWLERMPPYQGGGDMIRSVSFDKVEYNDLPYKFEAGTPNIAGVIGLGAAINYLSQWSFADIQHHEQALLQETTQRLQAQPGIRIIGTASDKIGVISFVMADAHAHDIGTIVDQVGVALRVGHHCAMPLMQRFAVAATARVSFALYNRQSDVEALMQALQEVTTLFALQE